MPATILPISRRSYHGRVTNQLQLASYRAFSTLIADRQFSNLGVVLLAILARVGKLVGLPELAPPAVSDIKPGQQAHNILATSLNQAGVDRGEVVKRVSPMSDMEAAAEADTVRPLTKELSDEERQKRKLTTSNVEGESPRQDTHPNKASESLLGVTDMGDDDAAAARAYATGVRGIKSKASHQLASGVVAHNTSSASSDKTPATPERKKKRRKKGNAIDELFAGLS
jgi:ribonuclease MRP protein subunit RMP1